MTTPSPKARLDLCMARRQRILDPKLANDCALYDDHAAYDDGVLVGLKIACDILTGAPFQYTARFQCLDCNADVNAYHNAAPCVDVPRLAYLHD
jgi:hypothetical protein